MSNEEKLKRAVKLLGISVIINILLGCATLNLTLPGMGSAVKIILVIINALIYGFFIWQINLKQNWARIASLIFFIVSLISTAHIYASFNTISNMMSNFGLSHTKAIWIYLITPTIQRVIEGTAMYLLFTKNMNTLFQKKLK